MRKDGSDELNDDNNTNQEENNFITFDLSDFPGRYRDVCPIGCGSKGLIFSAIDQISVRRLAIKKLKVRQSEKAQFLRQILREIRILHRLEHQNITKIYHVLVCTGGLPSVSNSSGKFPCPTSFTVPSIDTLYIGMELMDTDLRNVLAKSVLNPEYSRLFLYQILRAVKYMHSANVIHRDLTPSNIFINMDTLMLKIGDFGVSRLFDSEYDHTSHLSMPLATKYYQAPELLLHPHHYTKEIDIWAVGCIFIEMYKGSPAFTGDHVLDQMNAIMESVPVTEADWQSVVGAGCRNKNCCAPAVDFPLQSNNGSPTNPIEKILPEVDRAAINLLKQLLLFDPKLRIPAEDALAHPFFISYSNPSDEPSCSRPFHIEDELDDYSTDDLEAMLQNESYSVASSFSSSMDTTVPQLANLQGLDDINMLRVNSGPGLPENGSYRHLLSLAENTNLPEVLSESEVRTIACDFEYGVQIHDCSFNKDRMSMDFRPILSDNGCFDPYKWNSSNSSAPSTLHKGEANQGKSNKGSEPQSRDLSRFDTGYNSSYCSSSMTNQSYGGVHQVGHGPLSRLWSFSSPEVSSDQEHHVGCATPDSVNSQTFNNSTANSPVLLEEASTETITSNRHSDVSIGHQSSSRHHHTHHHHHHHHHHRHHKHKSRGSHRESTSSMCTSQKQGHSEIVQECQDKSSNAQETASRPISKRGSGKKKSRSPCDKELQNAGSNCPPDIVVVTNPEGDVLENYESGNKEDCERIVENTAKSHSEKQKNLHENSNISNKDSYIGVFDKKEAIHEHLSKDISTESKDSRNSAFKKYVPNSSSDLTDKEQAPSSSERIPLSFFAPDTCTEVNFESDECGNVSNPLLNCLEVKSTSCPPLKPETESGTSNAITPALKSEALAGIRNLWKNDMSILAVKGNEEYSRPRTWSEGSRIKGAPVATGETDLAESSNGCTLVQKIYSHFSQIFSDRSLPFKTGCCLTSQENQHSTSESTPLCRMRHFSDDRRYILSPRVFRFDESRKGTPQRPGGACSEEQKLSSSCPATDNMFPRPIKISCPRDGGPF